VVHLQIPVIMPPANKPNPAMGVRTLAMSATGRYLATINDTQRAAVWIWDLHVLSLVCVLKHEQPVVGVKWDPASDKLAICTASRRYALTLPQNPLISRVPLQHTRLKFCSQPDRTGLAI
jgi:hypothetical protein